MAWRVLVSAPYMQPVIDRFQTFFERNDIEVVLPPVHERMSADQLIEWLDGIDGVVCGDDRFTAEVFDHAHQLKVIAKWGTGVDSIDLDAAKLHNVTVYNTPGAFTEPVADTVLGYMLCFARGLPWMDREMRAGAWHKRPSVSLGERTLGVIGVGNIGKAVIRRAVVFGMRVMGNDVIDIDPEFVTQTGTVMTTKDVLLKEADFVSVNCTLNPTSRHLIGKQELDRMQRSAYLINTARGPIVDERALEQALKEGTIAGAALDVFEAEPLPKDSPLRKFDNVLLAPHNANGSPQAWERVHRSTLDQLVEGLRAVERDTTSTSIKRPEAVDKEIHGS